MIKELFSHYKKSSSIAIRYIFVAIVTFFINVFINKLDTITISYFYAVMLVMYFLEQSELALADVTSIFTLKTTRNKNKTASHLKTFLMCLAVFMLVISILIIIFKKTLFNNILGIEVIDNYKFLYLMLIAYGLSVPTLYFQDYLRFNDKSKEYLHTTIIFNFTLVVSFFGLILFDRSINNYAYANIIASVFTAIYTFSFIKSHKYTGFSPYYFLTRKFIDLKTSVSSSAKILIQYTLSYLSGFIKSLIMIRVSIDLFNTNEFLAKVFLICEGMFEALITTINIKLTKLLAEDKDKAFEYAKKGFKLIILNQIFLGVIYLIFRNFILGFINPEVYLIAHKVDIFLLMYISLSVIDWALSYNILLRNNKLGLQVFLEMFIFAGFILFLILLQLKVIEGMYLILVLMNLLIFIRIIINVIYFYSKKWL